MGLLEFVTVTLIGLSAGLVGGMLGIGGSIIMIPALTEFLGPNQHLYQAAAMIVNFFVVVPAVIRHRRAGAIDLRSVMAMLPMAAVAVVIGVIVSERSIFQNEGEAYLRALFAAFVLTSAMIELYRLRRSDSTNGANKSNSTRGPSLMIKGVVAIPVGLVAGLLGVGGGILAVPLQRRLLGLPIRTAIANSATIIIATSFIGAISKNYSLIVDRGSDYGSLMLAATLAPLAIVGSWIGSHFTHRLPTRIVKTAFLALLIIAGTRLAYKAATEMPHRSPTPTYGSHVSPN